MNITSTKTQNNCWKLEFSRFSQSLVNKAFEMLSLVTYCAVLCQFEQTTIAINSECLRQSQFQNNIWKIDDVHNNHVGLY